MIAHPPTPISQPRLGTLPDDPTLPQLATVADTTAIEPVLRSALGKQVRVVAAEVLRHKPARRCLLRYRLELDGEHRTVYAKAFASLRGPGAFATLQALHAATAGVGLRVPEPIAFIEPLRLLVIGEVPGRPVEGALVAGDRALARRIAEAFHRLHHSGASLPRRHDLAAEMAPLAERAAHLREALPHLADLADECLSLARRSEARPRPWRLLPIHRDCYADQIVTGEVIGLVDVDDAAMSEPAVDIANFTAHLQLSALRAPEVADAVDRSREAFSTTYRRLDHEHDASLVMFLEGTTLLRLADIHRTRPGGHLLAARLLERSRWLLERTG